MALGSAACGDEGGPVEIVVGEDACASCRMVFSSTATAAQIVAPGAAALIFDDLACLQDHLRTHALDAGAAIYVMEHRRRAWIDARHATFVGGTAPTPMASGLLAFEDAASARADPAGQHAVQVDAVTILSPQTGGRR